MKTTVILMLSFVLMGCTTPEAPQAQIDDIGLKTYEDLEHKFKAEIFPDWNIERSGCPFNIKGDLLCEIFITQPRNNYKSDPSDRDVMFNIEIYEPSTEDSIVTLMYTGTLISENTLEIGNKSGEVYTYEVRNMIEENHDEMKLFIVKTDSFIYRIHSDLCDFDDPKCDRILSGFTFLN